MESELDWLAQCQYTWEWVVQKIRSTTSVSVWQIVNFEIKADPLLRSLGILLEQSEVRMQTVSVSVVCQSVSLCLCITLRLVYRAMEYGVRTITSVSISCSLSPCLPLFPLLICQSICLSLFFSLSLSLPIPLPYFSSPSTPNNPPPPQLPSNFQ